MFPQGTTVADIGACCAACLSDASCLAGYVFDTAADSPNCWPLAGSTGSVAAPNRSFSPMKSESTNADAVDLYFFGHGHDYLGALQDFVAVSGKTIMTPRYTSGIWWSRWYDLGNYDIKKVVADYESRDIPLDVFVIGESRLAGPPAPAHCHATRLLERCSSRALLALHMCSRSPKPSPLPALPHRPAFAPRADMDW